MEITHPQEMKDLHHYWELRMCILLVLEPRKLFCLYYSWDQILGDRMAYSLSTQKEKR